MPTAECALLHRGGRSGTWGSLGLWASDDDDYAQACQNLARAVGQAAGVQPGDSVLSLACGAGDELLLWQQAFGAGRVCGVDQDLLRVQSARRLLARRGRPEVAGTAEGTVHQGSALNLAPLGLCSTAFDRVLCVDAAYHLRPRAAFLSAAWAALRPGGTLAYTDLALGPARSIGPAQPNVPTESVESASAPRPAAAATSPWLLRAAARLCGLPGDVLMAPQDQALLLQRLGWLDVSVQPLDEAVLGGFARHVRQQARRVARTAWHPDWRRPAITARLIGPCRAAGLGYVLLAARKPAGAAGDINAEATA